MKKQTWLLVIDWIGNEYADSLINIVQEHCKQKSHSLIIFTLGSISYILDEDALQNQIEPLFNDPNISKILICSAQLVRNHGGEKLSKILDNFRSKPTICIGGDISGFPLISSEYKEAYSNLMEHLWGIHGYRRFAWVGGPSDNPDAVKRKNIFLDFLTEKGTKLSPELDIPGNFNYSTGREAGHRLLDLQDSFDVVVAANDLMAIGVQKILGSNIPIVGFDNHSMASENSITTVDSEFLSMVYRAIDKLEFWTSEQFKDKKATLSLGKIIIRSSCGCDVKTSNKSEYKVNYDPSTEIEDDFFGEILESQNMKELTKYLHRVLPSKNINNWNFFTSEPSNASKDKEYYIIPERVNNERVELVIHSLFRDAELFGYFAHDISNGKFFFSERLRLMLCILFKTWRKQDNDIKNKRLMQINIDRFTNKQQDIKLVINSLPLWIIELDNNLNITYLNQKISTMITKDKSKKLHGHILNYVSHNDRKRVEKCLISVLDGNKPVSLDFCFYLPNGKTISTVCMIERLDSNGTYNLSRIFGSLCGGGIRMVGLDLKPILEGVMQPEDRLMKQIPFRKREEEVICLLANGLDTYQIANVMEVAVSTIRVHLHNIYMKTGVSNKKEFIELIAEYNAKSYHPNSITQVLLSRLFDPQVASYNYQNNFDENY